MHLSLISHPDRALTVRRLVVACCDHGHTLTHASAADRALDADVVLIMPPDDLTRGLPMCVTLWRHLPVSTARMVLVAPVPLAVMGAYLRDGADDCQPLTRDPDEILARCAALVRRRAPATAPVSGQERAVGGAR